MCSIEAHEKNQESGNNHKPVNDETYSGGARPHTSNTIEEALNNFV